MQLRRGADVVVATPGRMMDFLFLHEGMVQVRHQVCYRPPCALPSVCTLPCWEPEAVVQVACPICHAPGHSTESNNRGG